MPPIVIGAAALGGAAVAAGGIGAAFAAGGLIGFAANFGASMLLSGASRALMPRPSPAELGLQARTVTVREPVMPREMVYGRARKGGVIVFLHSSGKADKYLHIVLVLAAHRVRSIGAVYFEGEEAIAADGTPQGRWSGKLAVEKRLGAADQGAFESLRAALPEYWTQAHRLQGCAALYLRLSYDPDVFPGGIPNITVDMEGKDDILDPRTGGRGYSENAALCLADYMAHDRYGIGAEIGAEDGVGTESLIEAANICDERVPLDADGRTTEPRYSLNGVITLSEDPKTIIEAMLTAMAGRVVWQGGAWQIQAGGYRVPRGRLTAAHLREGGVQLTTRRSRAANFNAVRGQFVSPENDWQPDDFPAVSSAVYRAEDGGETVWRDLSLPFTLSASMAQRLARIELERARRQMTLRLDARLSAWGIAAVGESVLFDYPRWGFEGKPFEVQGLRLGLEHVDGVPLLIPEITLRETSPLIYDWDASEAQVYAAAPRSTLPSAWDIAPPGVPQGAEELYVTRDGSAVKVLLRVHWSAAESGFVDTYQLEARRDGGAWQDHGRISGTVMELRDIAPGQWDFRVKAISVLGVSSAWRTGTREVVGLTAPPAALGGLTIQSAGGLAVLKWQRAADVDVRVGGSIVIRHSKATDASWANSTLMDRVSGGEAIAVVPLKPGTYLLRPEDSEGRRGPVSAVTTKGVQILSFAQINRLVAEPDFAGARTGLVATGGMLRLETGTGPAGAPRVLAAEGLYQFDGRLDFGALRRVRLRSEILVGASALSDYIDDRTTPIESWADFDGSEGAEIDVVLEVRETDDDPAGPSPAWGPWGRVDNSEIEARAVEARAWLRTGDPAFTPLVSELRLIADEIA